MSTRNIVPRANGEGEIGVVGKVWKALRTRIIEATNQMTAPTIEATNQMTAPTIEATRKIIAGGKDVATEDFVLTITGQLKRSTAYKVGDCVHIPGRNDVYLECIKAGTTAATKPANLSTISGG